VNFVTSLLFVYAMMLYCRVVTMVTG